MDFKAKYISDKENKEKPDEKRILITNEAFAVCEMLEELMSRMGVNRK